MTKSSGWLHYWWDVDSIKSRYVSSDADLKFAWHDQTVFELSVDKKLQKRFEGEKSLVSLVSH